MIQSSLSRGLFFTLVFTSVAAFSSFGLSANDWPRFRGPDGNGIVEKIEHPISWTEDSNLAWKVSLPGGGLSSPVVIGERIFLTAAVGATLPKSFAQGVANMRPKLPEGPVEFQVLCHDLKTGKKLWSRTLAKQRPEFPVHSSNSYATESPAEDGGKLFVYFSAVGKVFALDLDGKQVWSHEVGRYPTGNGFGPGSSILAHSGKVFVQCDNDRKSFLLALNGTDGSVAWRKERQGRTSWATPLLWQHASGKELVACGSGKVTAYNPEDGAIVWNLSGISSSFSASPASDTSRIYFGNSGPRSSGPLVAVNAGTKGEHALGEGADSGGFAWSKSRSGPGMSSPVSVDGFLYVPGRGMLTCYKAESGEQVYKNRLPLKSTAASMWGGKGVVFLMDEKGKAVAIETGPEFKILATNEIDDLFWSTPAVAGSSLLLRGSQTLYCIR